ncbi:hypothetical protein [Prosthecobacter dejongeii]|uniref:Uncharacterized protein n=1 Tax=Prosthecobacter dejongeii TaxID=48465 RepID=A0A7W7YLP4_9BACT|nr:hypothetical protein [Prosthecobacter dejongeii]MBB5038516.1 hypothetical protein [Prosthecobacter dejongeii]
MKICSILALLLLSTLWSSAQLASMQLPKTLTWVEESSQRDSRGNITRTCSVYSIEGADWRHEFTNQEAEIAITVCRNNTVVSTQTGAAPSGPIPELTKIYEALSSRAKFEVVDIIGGTGYSRYRESLAGGGSRLIWMDRAMGFPRRISTTYPDGSTQEQSLRVITVDSANQRRLFDSGTLYPFFGHQLDEWHARVSK